MADWFKFYENAIDEPRFAVAIGNIAESFPVFVLTLSECCRHKSGTIQWGDKYQLEGYAKKLNIPLNRFNEAVLMLQTINYVSIDGDRLTCLKWNDLQSDYCQRKTRLQNQSGESHWTKKCPNSVRTVSEHSPDSVRQEERRGEEKRGEYILSPLARRIGGWFHRREQTPWHPKELQAFKVVNGFQTPEEDLALLEEYYTSSAPFKRKDIKTLLNNWNGEIDRARAWKANPNFMQANKPQIRRNRGQNI